MSLMSFQGDLCRLSSIIMVPFLSPEILDNIFRHVNVSPQQLLICRSWYHPIRRRFLEDVQLSPSALFRIPLLSDRFMEPLYSYTRSVTIILSSPGRGNPEYKRDRASTVEHLVPYSDAWVYGVNTALIELAWKIRFFRRLRSFVFCNFLETGTSWNVIHVSTFESILSSLSSHNLEFVKIDIPGADLENRLRLYEPWVDKPHVCEIICKYFPQSRHVYLRMREICSDLLQFKSCCRPLLEILVIDLNLTPNPPNELVMDSYVVDCQYNERFGISLLNVLVSDVRRLGDCSEVPNIKMVRFLCKDPDIQYRSSGSVSNTEVGAVWNITLRAHSGVAPTTESMADSRA
jgi:hypothetical protein